MVTTYTYPHSIRNNFGEQINFLERQQTADGEVLIVSNLVKPNSGPPMHTHWLQNELLTVVKGEMSIQLQGQEPRVLKPGETATFMRGEPHRFWNSGSTDLECTGKVWPPNNLEYFLEEVYASMDKNGGKPGGFEGAYLSHRYRSEFDMPEIPSFVKRGIFPIVIFFGKLAGKHRQFANAPEPVKG